MSEDVKISLFCADPSKNLRSTMDKFKGVILFSATLSPFNYFIRILERKNDDYRLKFASAAVEGLSFKVVETTYISIAGVNAIGSQRVTAYLLECVAN